jgi:3-methyl-2-oxobutanoate hydroxymethyltransferase
VSQASGSAPAKRVTTHAFAAAKARGDRLVMVTAYDALFARLVDDAGVDAILVGDSLGNVVAGYDTTVPVTLDQMIYHGAAVRRGAARALVVVDMPFLTYQVTTERALLNCGRVMQETRCDAVKLEGGSPEIADTVRALGRAGVPVMGHLGFTPQSVHVLGGFRVQGRDEAGAARLVDEARRLEDAGAFAVVLELVPAAVAERVRAAVAIPTIGIGAGAACDGQVLVLQDLLGLTDGFSPKFLKRYATMAGDVRAAVSGFAEDVRGGRYPGAEHSF